MCSLTKGEEPENLRTASSLIENAKGAVERNERQMAKVYLALAARYFEKAHNNEAAERTRVMARGI